MWPFSWAIDLGMKTGSVIANNLLTGQDIGPSLADVLSRPNQPVIINNPVQSKSFTDSLGIGFIEKNVIIIGLLAIGGLAVVTMIKKS